MCVSNCRSNVGKKSGFRVGRFAVYTLTTSGLVVGGALAYASYDPVFKNKVDEMVPGFAQWADTVADLFVDRARSTWPPAPAGKSGERGSRFDSHRGGDVASAGKLGRKESKVEESKTEVATTVTSPPTQPVQENTETSLTHPNQPPKTTSDTEVR